ncbi:MAG: class I SAM-dependent methyltransferase [Hyphomicrobiaceae bacterium]
MNHEKPLATQLRELWSRVDAKEITGDVAMAQQERLLDCYRQVWAQALLIKGETDLTHSTLQELAIRRGTDDLRSVRRRCEDSVKSLKRAWDDDVPTVDALHVERFYDRTELFIDELMWWHTLNDDQTPLAYVTALQFATAHRLSKVLDFGSGVGSGGLLFVQHGCDVTLGDISSLMLEFCAWRFQQRHLTARFIDLKTEQLPKQAFDFITAMDVFEHLTNPVDTVDILAEALKPGGYIFGRFASEIDPDRPMHLVQNFQPVFDRLNETGFAKVWRDDWLWGHQVFRKEIRQ